MLTGQGTQMTGGPQLDWLFCLVHWADKKQQIVARRSTYAKYQTFAITIVELAWTRMLLYNLHIPLFYTTTLYCDNISALTLASNPNINIEINYHFIR